MNPCSTPRTFMKKKKIINILIYILSFSASAVGIALNFFLARVLEAEAYGNIQYYVALATTCSQFMILGLNTFLIREAKNKNQNGQALNKCLTLYTTCIIFYLPIISFVLRTFVFDGANGMTITIILILSVAVLMGFNTLFAAYYQGSGKYHISIIFDNLIPKMSLLVLAIVFTITFQLDFFQANYLIFYVAVYSIIVGFFLFKNYRQINFNFQRDEIKSICFFFGVTITYSLGNNLTKIIQGGLYDNAVALAIISVSLSIVSLVRVFTSVLGNMVKPIFAKMKRDNNYDGLLKIYRFDTRLNSYISIPLYLFFVLHSKSFLYIFGPSYTVYPSILVFIALANAVSDLTGPNGTMLAMTGKEKWEFFNGFLYFSAYIASIFVFSFDKIYGPSIALLSSQIVVNIAKYIEVWVIYKKNPLDLKTIFSLLIIIFIDFCVIYGSSFLKTPFWAWFLINIPIGGIVVIVNCFLLSLYRKTDFKELIELRL